MENYLPGKDIANRCCVVTFLSVKVYVVVNFLSQVIVIFPLFLGMAMYANEVKTKEK